jgi:predicted phage terminase large subunit-like protein
MNSELQKRAEEKVAQRARCKTDKLYLSQVLGYDFCEDPHAELFANYLQIRPGIDLLDQDTIKDRLVLWPRTHYKALDLDTLIPTPTGFARMGDLKPGDVVFSDTGLPCRVTGVSPVFLNRECYEVEFSTGEKIFADAGHLWETDARRDRDAKHRDPVLRKSCPSIKTTEDIFNSLRCRGESNHRIKLAGALQLPEASLPVPPYVLGAWLGDGTSSCGAITCDDPPILDEIRKEGQPVSKGRAQFHYALNGGPEDPAYLSRKTSLCARLRQLGVLNNKHIPQIYLRASYSQRLALLQGLMDTDGSISQDGQCVFCNTNPVLARQVRELIASLGLKAAQISRYKSFLKGHEAQDFYQVRFYAYKDVPVFRLPRKYERQKTRSAGSHQKYRQIVNVRKAASRPVRCIEVDSPSHLYLAGEGFIPTHNTYSLHVEAIQLILNFPDIRILIMKGKLEHSRQLLQSIRSHFTGEAYGSRLKELFPEFCEGKKGKADSWTTSARIRKNQTQPTLAVASPQALKTGEHFDVGFFDDLVHEKNFRNPALVQKAIDDFNHYTPLVQHGYKYVTGTRYVFGDLYEWIIDKNMETESWKITQKACWTEQPDGSKEVLFKRRVLPDGRPIGFTLEMLLRIQMEDPEMFSAQYLNQPALADQQKFTLEMLSNQLRTDRHEEFPAGSQTIFVIDLASSKKKKSDHSVILAGRADGLGRAWVVDCRGDRWDPPELSNHVIEMALEHRPIKILVEGTAAGRYFIEYLKLYAYQKGIVLPLDELKVDNQDDAKKMRITSLAQELKNNRLFFLIGLPVWQRIVKEFTEYAPGRKHDDYPDTIALLVQYFRANVNQRPVPSILDHPLFSQSAVQESIANNHLEPSETHHEGLGGYFA